MGVLGREREISRESEKGGLHRKERKGAIDE